ncbi:MAG: hypothetical protein IIT38_00975, partial [Bacteroidales bacterium]|nr:hypothetical protein [Bacteroidales bacterium]
SDCENIVETLENKLQEIDKPLRKRIISCAIELLQNNTIHNKGNGIDISVIESDDCIMLKTARKLEEISANYLNNKIQEINNISVVNLKVLFQKNLSSENLEQGTGNGLILCRLKSDSDIETKFSDETFEINLTFNR